MVSFSSDRRTSLPLLAAFCATILWVGCSDNPVIAPDGQESDLDLTELAPDAQLRELAPALVVFERNRSLLVDGPNVAAAGVSLNERGRPAMRVYVTGPVLDDFPDEVDGVPVILEESAPFVALQDQEAFEPQKKCENPPCNGGGGNDGGGGSDPTARFPRPVPIGVSTGHFSITAGTIGMRVSKNGQVFALSNNHVYANENQATVGQNVLQPGPYDGGQNPADAIGTLAQYVPIVFSLTANNRVDAAIALTSTGNLGTSTPSAGYGTPRSSIMDASVGLKVQKYGRTTGLTRGSVEAINATVNVGYSTGTARFTGQVILCCSMSAGGDSGSLIVVDGKGRDKADNRRPVGLLFAGNQLYTIANPIDEVLGAFGVTIDGN
jgi:hypothetical protein